MTLKKIVCIGMVVLCLLLLAPASAQDSSPPAMLLTSPDPDFPVRMQLIAAGEQPRNDGFLERLCIVPDAGADTVYVALRNTGWSEGVIGLSGEALDAASEYVALEVGHVGLPLPDGLAFPLVYDAALGEAGEFRLHVVLAGPHTFAIYQLSDDGQNCPCKTTALKQGQVTRTATQVTVVAEPVFTTLLECHIVALPQQMATEVPEGAAQAQEWGACGSCNTCVRPDECILSPDGDCIWDPGQCGSSFAVQPASSSAEVCVVTNEMAHCVRWTETCPQGVVTRCIQCYDNCGNPTLGGCNCSG